MILIDCEHMRFPYNGLYSFSESLTKEFDKLEDSPKINYMVHRHCPKLSEFVGKSYYKTFFYKIFFALPSIYKVVHLTFSDRSYFPYKRRNQKFILTIHHLNIKDVDTFGTNIKLRTKYLKKVQKRVDKSDIIVAISEYTKKEILENIKVDPDKIRVIYNGLPKFKSPQKPNRNINFKFIFSIGSILEKKNFHTIIPILKNNKDLHYIIAGMEINEYVETVIEEAKKYQVEDRLHIVGFITDEERTWYYQNCEAFMFPSLVEGFGIPVIESLSFGKPCFLSTEMALPEVGGEHAYYFDNFEPDNVVKTYINGMKDYCSNKEEKKKQYKQYVKKFTWEKSAKEYLKLYKELYYS